MSEKNALKLRLDGVRENEVLSPYTSFKIGGPARYFFEAHTKDDLAQAVKIAKECGVRIFILGGASNILISDKGFDGLVIFNQIKGLEFSIAGGAREARAGAGESWDNFVQACVERGWQGVECLSGIPGTVGASPVQNIGAYGQSVDSVIKTVYAIDCATGEEVEFDRAACQFGYRTSIFKQNSGRFVITQVVFVLRSDDKPALTYHDLQSYFSGKSTPTLTEIRKAVIEIRARKGYVLMPQYECYQTAGSFFMNPIISSEQFQRLLPLIKECPSPWYWALPNGAVKVSTACLLQNAGFAKGYRKGKVGISPKHSLSLINLGGASAQEIVTLAQEIKKSVLEKFGIELKEEVQVIGF